MSVTTNSARQFSPVSGHEKLWSCAFLAVLIGLSLGLMVNIGKPFVGYQEWGSTIWCQSAHNNLRAGLRETLGVPSGMYCGPLPIPHQGFFVDHPPILPLGVTAMFALFGEHEWAARLVPVVCSVATAILLWLLVRSFLGARVATLSAAVFALQPMELYYGRVVDHEACGLMWMFAALLCFRLGQLTSSARWIVLALVSLWLGMWIAWPVYILAGVVALFLFASRDGFQVRLGLGLIVLALASFGLYVWYVHLVRPEAWDRLFGILQFRAASSGEVAASIPWRAWLGREFEYLSYEMSPTAWGLAVIGIVQAFRGRRQSEHVRWFMRAALILFITAALWIVGFRNGSYLHSFWSFYFLAPVALMAGYGLDWLLDLGQSNAAKALTRRLACGAVVAALAVQGFWGWLVTRELHSRQYSLVDVAEPQGLIATLGNAIARAFPIDTFIITNLPAESMPLEYYAHRNLIYFDTFAGWREVFSHQGKRCRGVIWMGSPGARTLLVALPKGDREMVEIGGHKFCLWKPDAEAESRRP